MKHKNSQSGFTLIEISIVLLILGMITGAVFAFVTPMQELKYRQSTQEKQKIIVRALANYAQMNGKLPCPADPNPAPISDLGIERTSCGSDVLRNGVVPWRTLGLTEENILDGWKRPFTYIVDEKANSLATTAHEQCRLTTGTAPWVSGGVNAKPNKALFCCQRNDGGSRLEIFNNAAMTNADLATLVQNGPAGVFDAPANGTGSAVSTNLAYFPFALISHGKNGMGVYYLRQTGRMNMPAGGSVEAENTDDDADVLDLAYTTTMDNTYFDDIVVWRTQQGLISEFGNDSCALP